MLGTVMRKKDNNGRDHRPRDGDQAQGRRAGLVAQPRRRVPRSSKREDDAIKVYEKAIELTPNEARYHFDLGVAYRRKDDRRQGDPGVREGDRARPGNADAWFDLGFMYKRNNDNDKAIDAWDHYLCLKHDSEGEKRISEEMTGIGGKAQCKGGAKTETPKPDKKPAPKKK